VEIGSKKKNDEDVRGFTTKKAKSANIPVSQDHNSAASHGTNSYQELKLHMVANRLLFHLPALLREISNNGVEVKEIIGDAFGV